MCEVVHGPLCVLQRFGASSGMTSLAYLKVKLEKMESSGGSASSLGKLLCGGLARAEVSSPGVIPLETATQEQNTQLTMAAAAVPPMRHHGPPAPIRVPLIRHRGPPAQIRATHPARRVKCAFEAGR